LRTLKLRSPASRRGSSLVEVLVSCGLGAMLFGVAGLAMVRTNRTFRATDAVGDAERLAERSIQRVAREFRDVNRNDVVAAPTLDSIEYRRIDSIDGETVTKTPLRRVRLEPDPRDPNDGIDNDRDGRVDEKRVVLATDTSGGGPEAVLVEHVRELLEGELANGIADNPTGLVDEPGFCVTYDAATGVVTLRLTVERAAPESQTVVRTTEIATRLRNAGL
jgi:hypothetical protein